jgi:hypothetical protein
MNKIRKNSRLHDLIMEVLRNNAELYQEVKTTLVSEVSIAPQNGHSGHLNDEELMKRLDIIIDEDFVEYDEVFKALA